MKTQNLKTQAQKKYHYHTIIQSYSHSKGWVPKWLCGFMQFLKLNFQLFIISILILSACDKGPPIPEEKFIKIYVDLLIIQDTSVINPISVDSMRTLVFIKNDLTAEQYDRTIEYFNSRPEKWEAFFDSATAYVERLRKIDK